MGLHSHFTACAARRVSVVRVLLTDPRVDVALADNYGHTLLWFAFYFGHVEIIEWLIASDRELGDVENRKGKRYGDLYSTALEIAIESKKTELVSLLERFLGNPVLTRHEVRVKLGVLDELAAEVFALTVFLCDELLQLKPASHPAATPHPAATSTNATLLHCCQEAAHEAANGPLSSRCGFREAEYSSKGFRGCLQITCQDSSFF